MTSTTFNIPFCINCKYIATVGSMEWEKFRCFHPLNKKGLNPVNGKDTYKYITCDSNRKDFPDHPNDAYINNKSCGPEGRWFEAKEITPIETNREITNFIDLTKSNKLEQIRARLSKNKSTLSTDDLNNL